MIFSRDFKRTFILIIFLVVLGTTALSVYNVTRIKNITADQETQQNKIISLEDKANDIETILLAAEEKNLTLEEALEEARERAEDLEDQFDDIDDTVGSLEKLSKTDAELLRKYSKVSFLNENYAPSDLSNIPSSYVFNSDRTYKIHTEVLPFLEDMLDEAEDDNIDISVISAFRSFGDQSVLKGNYTVLYGAGSANQFSADQGFSEHQLGTTVDFTNSAVGATFSGFAQTEAYSWLKNNAYKYGFVLSYPESNSYYQFEPWHWRFVGERLAKDLRRNENDFYDLTQREIDEYLIRLFD
jgi:D-alanyl-D-alanine carboxypeptidase